MHVKAKSGVALAPELIIITAAWISSATLDGVAWKKVKITQTYRLLLLPSVVPLLICPTDQRPIATLHSPLFT